MDYHLALLHLYFVYNKLKMLRLLRNVQILEYMNLSVPDLK